MAWALITHAKSGVADGNNGPFRGPHSGTVDTTAADLYLVAIGYYASGGGGGVDPASSTLVDVSGNTYTFLPAQHATGDDFNRVLWAYKVAPVTSAVEAWTVTQSGGVPVNGSVVAMAFSGCAASPTITHTGSPTTTSTPAAGSLGASGNLVCTAYAGYTTNISSIDSSFAIVDSNVYTAGNDLSNGAAWQNLSAGVAGAVNPTWTLTGSPTASACQAISFTGTGGGGGSRGLFGLPTMTGTGTGGSFFPNPLQAPQYAPQMVRRNHIYVPAWLGKAA